MQRVRKQIEVPENSDILTGRGVTVAVLDTGLGRHPDLRDKLLCFHDFVNGRRLMYDDSGHGTHVCGIICGNGKMSEGKYRGMAPAAMLIVGKVLDGKGDGSTKNMLEALDWVMEVREQYNVKILNISVGIGTLDCQEKEIALKRKIEEVWDKGIIVVCAAGNKGPGNGSISSIGGSGKIITVGCHDGNYCSNHSKCCESYSGRGKVHSNIRKPDLVAPGTDIISCNAAFRNYRNKKESAYIPKSGTSMATPIVAGAAALALQKYPHMTNEEFRQRITLTATDLREPWNKQGWGMVNIRRLLE